MKLTQLPDGHWAIGDKPVYELAAEARKASGLTKGKYAKLHGIRRGAHYAFEARENRSFRLVNEELAALGYKVSMDLELLKV